MREITVQKGLFSRYSTISKAIKAAQDGDTLIIKAGTYEEAFILDKAIELTAAENATGKVTIRNTTTEPIYIKANAVLRGLVIEYAGSAANTASICITYGSPTLETCTITSATGSGLIVKKGSTPFLQGCTISKNKYFGVSCEDSAVGKFVRCTIAQNGFSNIGIRKKANPTFLQCDIYGSQSHGIGVEEDGFGQFTECHIYNNTKTNIYMETSGNASFVKCKIDQGQRVGICIEADGLGSFSECTIENNHESNIKITEKGNPHFEQCTIAQSKMNGIFSVKGGKGSFKNCEILGNAYPNIYIASESSTIFENCKIYNGLGLGVCVSENGAGSFINCEIYSNAKSNILIDTNGNPSLENCAIYDSQQYGIWIDQHGRGSFSNCAVHSNKFANIKIEKEGHPKLQACSFYDGQDVGICVAEGGLGEFLKCQSYNNNEGQNILSESDQAVFKGCTDTAPVQLTDILQQLDQLIGLSSVKNQIRKTIQFIEFNKEVSQYGLNAQDVKLAASHTVLSGNPGTGKTTVARLLGSLYAAMGVLPSGHLVAVNREKLVGQYIGQTAPKTKEWIEQAIGGVLFIDEAYELSNKGGGKDFGAEAIAVILEEMENRRGEFIVVVAGYEDEMKQFLETNPGLQSRFNQSFKLEDYTPEEMKQIALKLLKEKERSLNDEGLALLEKEFINLWRKRDRFFANARTVRNLVEAAIQQQAERCMMTSRSEWNPQFLTTVTAEDIQAILPKEQKTAFILPIQEDLLSKSLKQLDDLIGLDIVKAEVHKLVTLVKYYREENKDISVLSPHTVLKGSPGTGKTEVARIIARIYEALGILERGDLVEVNRDKLVSPYTGESEKLIRKYIDQAMGGTLFIDEAYQLTQYGADDPGHKVVEILLKDLEDKRGQFIVLVAGYPAQMDSFLRSNDGLQRRFVRQLTFEDYTPAQLMEITHKFLNKYGYLLDPKAQIVLQDYYQRSYAARDMSFGNAGFARSVVTETIKNTDYRVAQMPKEERTPLVSATILAEDIAMIQTK